MRLIDADEIIKETWGAVIKDMFHMDETVDVISRKDIDNALTIKAIPIEWIEKYIWKADTHEEKRALRKMFMAWEKENEQAN